MICIVGVGLLLSFCTGFIQFRRFGTAMKETFGSTCHGAGRQMSRKTAIENLNIETVRKKMADQGIYLRAGSDEGVLEEAPDAYKDVSEIIEVVCNAGLTAKVAKLTPIGVVKG